MYTSKRKFILKKKQNFLQNNKMVKIIIKLIFFKIKFQLKKIKIMKKIKINNNK